VDLFSLDTRLYFGYFNPSFGAVAQLGERLNGIQEVSGSIPLSSISCNTFDPFRFVLIDD
jgi:hypothetical protein